MGSDGARTPRAKPARPSVIELSAVDKTYDTGELTVQALRSVDLIIGEGEFVAIMGPSGSGKTTLLAILGCLDRPTHGSYELVGEEMSSLDETRRAHVRGERIGFVFQAYNLLPRTTAYRNVELPLVYAGVPARERRERVLAALADVGLSDRTGHLPTQLSGGQQQRVAVARALVMKPSVLLLDEPTGNLDSTSEEEVLTLLEQVNREGATLAMVTHSNDVAERASRIVRLADGMIVSDEPARRTIAMGAR
jgi:putative ABC transport system ATP-binding protein